MNNIGAIILAAGKGKRMNSKIINKVALPLGQKPMIIRTFETLQSLGINKVVIVIGFAKHSVIELFGQRKVMFAEQKKRLGTAHAVIVGMKKMPEEADHILVLNGDDSALYKTDTISELVKKHLETDADLTFLTIEMENPNGLGRVVRGKGDAVLAIVEEKDATEDILKIKEINPACYIFKKSFLKKYLKTVEKSKVAGEYYITSLIDIGIKHKQKIETLQAGVFAWRGVNTKEELREAENILLKINK